MMGYFLLDNPPATQQFYPSRANPLTGGVLIHTTESNKSSGALSIAQFIARRSDYGSYHCIVSATETIPMLPDSYTAYHCAANGYNSRTWGISLACRTTDLHPDDSWTQAAIARVAWEVTAFWIRNNINPFQAAVMRPAAELLYGPGMATHGDAQPWDRSDAWTRHPQRADLEALLLEGIALLLTPKAPQGVDPKVNKPFMITEIVNDKSVGTCVYWENTPWRVKVQSADDFRAWQFLGVPQRKMSPAEAAFFKRYTQEVKTG